MRLKYKDVNKMSLQDTNNKTLIYYIYIYIYIYNKLCY